MKKTFSKNARFVKMERQIWGKLTKKYIKIYPLIQKDLTGLTLT